MTVPARTSLATLGVADVAKATEFYERLGWRPSSASVPGVISFFDTNGVIVGLFANADLAAEANLPATEPPPFRGFSLSMNLENEAEVDRVLAEAAEAGGTLLKPGTRADWGGYSGYFADPDGNVWEAAVNPGWPLDETGRPQLPD